MQHVAISEAATLAHAIAFPPKMTATAKRAFAIQAHADATAAPDRADWRAVADLLAAALPRPKADASLGHRSEPETEWAPWAHYGIPNSKKIVWPSPVLIVQFAGGRSVRVSAPSLKGKPINVGRAVARAVFMYRWHVAHALGETSRNDLDFVAVPEIVSIRSESGSDAWSPEVANAETAELRAGSFDLWAEIAMADGREGWRETVHARFLELQPSRAKEREDIAKAIAAYEALQAQKEAAHAAERDESVVVSLAAARARRLMAGTSLQLPA